MVVLSARYSHPVPTPTVDDSTPAEQEQDAPLVRQTRLNQQQIAALTQEYLDGAKLSDLAQTYNINRKTASIHVRRSKVGTRRRYPVMNKGQIKEAAIRYNAGDSLNSLARTYQVHPATLKKYLVEAGVVPRS